MGILVVVDGVVLLVVESDASFVLADAFVSKGLEEIDSLIDDNLVGDIGVSFIDEVELVSRQLLDGEVGAADCAFSGEYVGGFGNTAVEDVVDVGFVCFHEKILLFCLINIK